MNRVILTEDHQTSENTYLINDESVVAHLRDHLKVQEADQLKGCLLNNSLGNVTVKKINSASIELVFEPTGKGLETSIDLIIGASRPPTCKKVLEHGSSMGVHDFHFFQAELSEKSYLSSKIFQDEKFRDFTRLGVSQSAVYSREPKVFIYPNNINFTHFDRHQKFILSLNGEKTFQDVKINKHLPVALAIGPERGWTQEEEFCFEQMGFTPIKISRSVLRVEQAVFSALAQLEMLTINRD